MFHCCIASLHLQSLIRRFSKTLKRKSFKSQDWTRQQLLPVPSFHPDTMKKALNFVKLRGMPIFDQLKHEEILLRRSNQNWYFIKKHLCPQVKSNPNSIFIVLIASTAQVSFQCKISPRRNSSRILREDSRAGKHGCCSQVRPA